MTPKDRPGTLVGYALVVALRSVTTFHQHLERFVRRTLGTWVDSPLREHPYRWGRSGDEFILYEPSDGEVPEWYQSVRVTRTWVWGSYRVALEWEPECVGTTYLLPVAQEVLYGPLAEAQQRQMDEDLASNGPGSQ